MKKTITNYTVFPFKSNWMQQDIWVSKRCYFKSHHSTILDIINLQPFLFTDIYLHYHGSIFTLVSPQLMVVIAPYEFLEFVMTYDFILIFDFPSHIWAMEPTGNETKIGAHGSCFESRRGIPWAVPSLLMIYMHLQTRTRLLLYRCFSYLSKD